MLLDGEEGRERERDDGKKKKESIHKSLSLLTAGKK